MKQKAGKLGSQTINRNVTEKTSTKSSEVIDSTFYPSSIGKALSLNFISIFWFLKDIHGL